MEKAIESDIRISHVSPVIDEVVINRVPVENVEVQIPNAVIVDREIDSSVVSEVIDSRVVGEVVDPRVVDEVIDPRVVDEVVNPRAVVVNIDQV